MTVPRPRTESRHTHAAVSASIGSSDRAPQAATDPLARLQRTHTTWLAQHSSYGLLVAFVQEFQRHDPGMLAKQAAYSLLYAVPSILILLMSLASLVDRNTDAEVSLTLQLAISQEAPEEVQPLLQSLVETAVARTSENTARLTALLAFAVAVWGGAGGVGALMYAVNRVYDVRDTRSFLKANLLRLGLMLLGGILVVGALLLFTLGRAVGDRLPDQIAGSGTVLGEILASGPLWALLMILGSLLLLYWVALDVSKSLKWLLPGAAAATLAMTIVFAFIDFLLTYANPGGAFGAAGSVVMLLWSLFIVSQIVIIGAIVNSVLGHRHDPTLIAALERHPEKILSYYERDKADENTPAPTSAVPDEPGPLAGTLGPQGQFAGKSDADNRQLASHTRVAAIARQWGSRVHQRLPELETLVLRCIAGASLIVRGAQKPTASRRKHLR